MSFKRGDFVWLTGLDGNFLAIYLGKTYLGPVEAEVLTGSLYGNTPDVTKVNGELLEPAYTIHFKKKHLREAIALLHTYFRMELEACVKT